ncbi:hypothetical protein ACFFHT_10315 [Gallibacterium melopsittaci]|uniref:Uncharacterized protein n=1 Tax=Gallibacterium melopsittaci TaxID=516063 RepID=A0ABV6HYI5_9PAST
MEQQQEILSQITQLLHNHCQGGYLEAYLEYKFSLSENWSSFSSWFIKENKNNVPNRFSELKEAAEPLCEQLYFLMKEKNDWRKMELKIDKDRRVSVHYSYEKQSL